MYLAIAYLNTQISCLVELQSGCWITFPLFTLMSFILEWEHSRLAPLWTAVWSSKPPQILVGVDAITAATLL